MTDLFLMRDHAVERSLRHLTTYGRQPCTLNHTRCSRQLNVWNIGDCQNGSIWHILQIYIMQRHASVRRRRQTISSTQIPRTRLDCLPSETVQKRLVAQTYPSGYVPAMLDPAAGGPKIRLVIVAE
ncbi:hypothetical protein MRX96_052832 [Rhipicephalus microplus]